jgi:outer membrane protein assembly factor BamB
MLTRRCSLIAALVGALACALLALATTAARADDWPQWGNMLDRNMVSDEQGLPDTFDLGRVSDDGGWLVKPVNIKWSVRLGNQTYGTPVIAGGRVFVGTNNGAPRNAKLNGDRLVLMCFDEDDGGYRWQLAAPRRVHTGQFSGHYPGLGICSSPAVEGDRVYLVTSHCDVVCMTTGGLGKARKPLYADEAQYLAQSVSEAITASPKGPRLGLRPGRPVALDSTDANVVWVYDMLKEVGSWPHDASDSSVLLYGDYLYVATGNGQGSDHHHIPSPNAPSLIVLDKRTGKLVAKDTAHIGPRVFHGQWSSPSLGVVNGRPLVFYGGGDGFCYAFDARPEPGVGGKPGVLRTVWRFDACPPEYRKRDGRVLPYDHNGEGPCEIIATPVFYRNRVYVAIGQDPRHGIGKGCLTCIDATKTGDTSAYGAVWRYQTIGRSLSTVAIADGLVYAADLGGQLYCLDAETGKGVWSQKLGAHVWGSPLVADGKVYLGTEKGDLWILRAGRNKQVLATIPMHGPVYATPVAANGVLYVATHKWLYAVKASLARPAPAL